MKIELERKVEMEGGRQTVNEWRFHFELVSLAWVRAPQRDVQRGGRMKKSGGLV